MDQVLTAALSIHLSVPHPALPGSQAGEASTTDTTDTQVHTGASPHRQALL